MFIDRGRNQRRPPSGGQCQSAKIRDALYRHGSPGGGRPRLVTAFYKHGPPDGGRPQPPGWGIAPVGRVGFL